MKDVSFTDNTATMTFKPIPGQGLIIIIQNLNEPERYKESIMMDKHDIEELFSELVRFKKMI